MSKVLKEKVDSMQEQMGNLGREMEALRKNQKEMLEIKNTNKNEECLWWAQLREESLSLKLDQ